MEHRLSAYVHNGKLCVLGVALGEMGAIPVSDWTFVGKDVPNGPIAWGHIPDELVEPLGTLKREILGRAELDDMAQQAGDHVERARAGDQNARAMLAEVGKAARAGSERARIVYRMAMQYAEAFPKGKGVFQGEKPDSILGMLTVVAESANQTTDPLYYPTAIRTLCPDLGKDTSGRIAVSVLIANGPTLSPERVNSVGSLFGREQEIFQFGFEGVPVPRGLDLSREAKEAYCTGFCLAMAYKLQRVRSGAAKIRELSPVAAWELGE